MGRRVGWNGELGMGMFRWVVVLGRGILAMEEGIRLGECLWCFEGRFRGVVQRKSEMSPIESAGR